MFHCKYFAVISSATLPLALIRERTQRREFKRGDRSKTEERKEEKRKKKGLGTKLRTKLVGFRMFWT